MRVRCLAPLVLSTIFSLLMALVIAPVPALADGFSMPRVSIDAVVQPDGALNVTERRSFDFDDDVNGVFWDIALGANEQGAAPVVKIGEVTEESNGATTSYHAADAASNGDAGVYTVEDTGSALRLKVYTPHASGDASTFTVSYTMTGAVMAWPDTAELYWKFVGDGWVEASEDVSLAVTFAGAAASGEVAKTGSDDANFRAWAHGPLNGEVSLDASAPSVAFTVSSVASGEFAEARIVFPKAWVPGLQVPADLSDGALVDGSGNRLPVILAEEQRWAEQANERREQARKLQLFMGAIGVTVPAVFLIGVVVVKLARGPKPKPTFTDTYFRDVPSDDHPAVIAQFMSKRGVGNRALVATLMKLTDERVVAVTKRSADRQTLFGGTKTEEDYLLTVPSDYEQRLDDAIDRAALGVYFPEGATEVAFADMKDEAKAHPDEFRERWQDFKDEVKARYEVRNLVRSGGVGAIIAGSILGVAVLMCTLVSGIRAGVWQVPAIGAPLTLAGVALCFTFKRFTPEGAELNARCRALKKWLEDFTRLGEAVPGDVILWNKLLVMAVALGVSEKVLEELAAATPASYGDGYGDGYYPAWWWCTGHHGMASPLSSVSVASDLALSELASSSDSSSGGFGGGFSGGGGGGAGGGGGGTF